MKNDRKTKSELIEELESVRRKVKKLETLLKKRKQTEKDITERKKIEETIKRSEEYFRAVIENASDIIIIVDKKAVIKYISPSVERFLGYKQEEMIGKSGFSFIQPIDLPRAIVDFGKSILLKENSIPNSFRVRHKDGSERVLEGLGKNLFDNPAVAGFVMNVFDVTERKLAESQREAALQASKQAEEALRVSEECFSKVFRASPDAMTISRMADGTLIELNDMWEKNLGYSRAESVGTSSVALGIWSDPAARQKAVRQLRETGSLRNFETDLRRKTGEIRQVSLSSERFEIGSEQCLLTIIQDITERKLAESQREAALQASKRAEAALRLHSEIMTNMNEGVVLTRVSDSTIIYTNPKFEKMFGYDHEELVGQHISMVNAPTEKNPEEVAEDIQRSLKKTGVWSGEVYNKKKDGTLFWCYASVSTFEHPEHGKVWVGIHTNITERKRAEEALTESEKKLKTLFEILPVGASVLDAERKIVYSNPALERILDISGEGLFRGNYKSRTYLRSDGTLMPAEEFASVRAIKEQRAVHNVETGVVKEDGKVVWTNVSAVPLGFPDWNVLIVTSDITERKRTELASMQAEEEIRKSHEELRMLADHLQTVREEERHHLAREFHDQLGQLMTALKMDLALLLRMISDEKQDISRKYFAEELKSAQKLIDETTQLIWEIIVELRPQMLDDLGLLAALEWETERFETRTGISCEFKSLAGDIQIDSKKSIALFRIYQEALTNIARHANATVVKSVLRRDDGTLVLEIKDNGCGILIDEQLKQKSLGLIGMRERALAIGGSFEISGVAGEGTTIIVRLPL